MESQQSENARAVDDEKTDRTDTDTGTRETAESED